MDNWEKFDETALPPKESFHSNLNLEYISDENYAYAQKVWKVFEINNHGQYRDLYVKSDTLLLQMYLKILEICVLIHMDLILYILHLD